MAFEKGKSGNPGGRRRRINTAEAAARQHAEDAIKFLADTLADEEKPTAERRHAAIALLERGYGKPREFVDIDLDAEHNHTTTELPEINRWIEGLLGQGEKAPSKDATTH